MSQDQEAAIMAAPFPSKPSGAHQFGQQLGKLWARKWFRYACMILGLLWVIGLVLPRNQNAPKPLASAQPALAKASTSSGLSAANAPTADVSASKPSDAAPDPVRERAEAQRQISEISARTASNEEKLKNYFATQEAVKRGNEDALKLATVALKFSMSRDKADQQIAAQARQQAAKVGQQVRVMYASSVKEIFIKNGLDAEVRASGSAKEQLTITYALMSQPLVYKFQNEMDLPAQAKSMGFKRLILTNGFESSLGRSWTFDLLKN